MSVEVDANGNTSVLLEKRLGSDEGYRASIVIGVTRVWAEGPTIAAALLRLGEVLDLVEATLFDYVDETVN